MSILHESVFKRNISKRRKSGEAERARKFKIGPFTVFYLHRFRRLCKGSLWPLYMGQRRIDDGDSIEAEQLRMCRCEQPVPCAKPRAHTRRDWSLSSFGDKSGLFTPHTRIVCLCLIRIALVIPDDGNDRPQQISSRE